MKLPRGKIRPAAACFEIREFAEPDSIETPSSNPAEFRSQHSMVGRFGLDSDRGSQDLNAMLGWHISVFQLKNGGGSPASFGQQTSTKLAVWQSTLDGLDWIDSLVNDGRAISLGGNGYPIEYTAQIKDLKVVILGEPPHARNAWVCGPDDIVTDGWHGKTTRCTESIDQCDPEEWVLIQAWDES